MLTRSKPNWELPESVATRESDFLNRRQLCKTIAAGTILAGSSSLISKVPALAATENDPAAIQKSLPALGQACKSCHDKFRKE